MIYIQFVSSAGLKLTLFASISNGASTVNNVFPSNSSRVTLNLARLKQSTKYCLTSSFSHFSEKQTRYSPAECRSFRQRVVSPTVVSQTSPVSSQTCRSQFANVINIHMCRSQFSSDFGCQHLTIQTNSQA